MRLGHFPALLLFALIVSFAFAFLTKETPGDRLRYAARSFLLFVLAAVLIGWLMFPFPR